MKTTRDTDAALARACDKCADAAAACREVADVWEEEEIARQPDPDTIVFTGPSPMEPHERTQFLAVAAHTVTRQLVEVDREVDRLLTAARDSAREYADGWRDSNVRAVIGGADAARENAQVWNDLADAYDRALQLHADAAAIVDMSPPRWSQGQWKSSCGK